MLRPASASTVAGYLLLIGASTSSLLACHTGKAAPSAEGAPALALSGLAGQRVVLLPTYTVRVAPELGWSGAVGRARDVQRKLDDELATALADRGATKGWIFPEALQQAYRRNAAYGADPYSLAEEPLRSPSLARAQRLPEPLASQVRTIVALHEDARLLLAPVELRFERAGDTMGRAVLKLVLLDARASDVRWIGEARSDSLTAYAPSVLTGVASRVADLVSR